MAGRYSRSSARSPDTTCVATGSPNGSKADSITLSCGKSGRWSLLYPNWNSPSSVTVQYPLAVVLSTRTRLGFRWYTRTSCRFKAVSKYCHCWSSPRASNTILNRSSLHSWSRITCPLHFCSVCNRVAAQACSLPVAMGLKGGIQQFCYPHFLALRQQHRNIVHSFCRHGKLFCHTVSLPQFQNAVSI